MKYDFDVIIIGAGLAGLVTAIELLESDKRVLLLDRDSPERIGGLARESFGGIMMVDTPHQRKSKIMDSPETALKDWLSYAEFENGDEWPRKWAEFYVHNSKELIWDWLSPKKVSFLPVVNWPERGMDIPGNSLPRWHIVWGTGYGLVESVLNFLRRHPNRNNLEIRFEHRVEEILFSNKRAYGCRGVLEGNGRPFEAKADVIVIAVGGICGGDLSKVKEHWHKDFSTVPEHLLNGSHRFADGMLHEAVRKIGGNLTHLDLQWHYAAGIKHPRPDRANHGLSLVPPRSALWFSASGSRIGPPPLIGYTDTRFLVRTICELPGQFSWHIMNMKIAARELAVSGSDYMTAFRNKSKFGLIKGVLFGNKQLVRRLINESDDFIIADSPDELAAKINMSNLGYSFDADRFKRDIAAYDEETKKDSPDFSDDQLKKLSLFRQYRGDRMRLCRFQAIDDPGARPLIAVRQFILTRKSLGGIQTDLECRVLDAKGEAISGLFAVGEAAGFGGGGIHGKRSLEGTFLGSCIITGQVAARSIKA